MKTSNDFLNDISVLIKEVYETTLELLKSNNVESINFTPYIVENYIDTYYFYDCDKNGNGEALEVSTLEVKGDKIIIDMDTNYGDYFGEYKSTDFTLSEQVYLLEMLESLFLVVEEENLPILKKDEYFD